MAETIVLPTKNTAERLAFTKHWLAAGEAGAVSVWAEEGAPARGDPLLGVQAAEVLNLERIFRKMKTFWEKMEGMALLIFGID